VLGLAPLLDFYTRVIGLAVGARPDIPAPGYWLYSQGQAIVHLYAIGESNDASTGPLDHISFSASGLDETRASLGAMGIPFEEAPVPGWPLHQVFLHDPSGLKVELTFSMDGQP
jgi:catechol 2,3-dioxygenase-like lactoylglutathione lyase family enzyme